MADRFAAALALWLILLIQGFTLAQDVYRQQHCTQMLGHWVSVERPSPVPLVCG